MSQRITIPFVGGTNKSKVVSVNNTATVNLINSIKSQGAKALVILENAPGLIDRGSAGNGACRTPQMYEWFDDTETLLYGVWGDKAVSIDKDYNVVELGTLENSGGTVRMARGRDHVMWVEGTAGWTWDGSSFLQITDLDFPTEFPGTVTHVVYMDGFFIVNHAEKDDFYISAKEDPTSWNALQFEAAAVAPDNSLALAATDSILYIVGAETVQPYYNSGNPDFPYDLYLTGVQEVGIAAPQSIAESDEGVFWLATTPEGGLFVYRMRGTQGFVISGEEQDEQLALEPAASISSIYGFIYKQEGKSFYVLQLNNSTLIYNVKANVWETRELLNGDAWRVAGHGILNRTNIVGSRLAAKFYEMSTTAYDDAGQDMIKRRQTQIIHHHGMLMDFWQVVIEFLPGVGTTGDNVDPQCRFRYSDDNGQSWSAQLFTPIGKAGEVMSRQVYDNLGESRNRMMEVEVSESVQIAMVNAYAVIEVLDD